MLYIYSNASSISECGSCWFYNRFYLFLFWRIRPHRSNLAPRLGELNLSGVTSLFSVEFGVARLRIANVSTDLNSTTIQCRLSSVHHQAQYHLMLSFMFKVRSYIARCISFRMIINFKKWVSRAIARMSI